MTKSWIENTKNCRKRIILTAFLTYCVLSYPFTYFAMSKGWGFYDKNPQTNVEINQFGHETGWSEGNIVSGRIALLIISPLSTPVNGLYMTVESTTDF